MLVAHLYLSSPPFASFLFSLGLHFLRSFALNIPSHLSLSLVRLDTVPYSTPLPVSPVPQGDTFYIFSAYPYFSAGTEFLPLDHRRSLSVCRCFLAHGWDSSTRERKCVCVCEKERETERERKREAPNYVSTLGLGVSLAFCRFLWTTVPCGADQFPRLCIKNTTLCLSSAHQQKVFCMHASVFVCV